jgi:hypothetical protein
VNNQLLGREPVITVSTVVALLIGMLPIFDWPAETVGIVVGALVVLGGAVEAALVSVDRLLPLLVGVAKAVLAVVAAFGLHVPDNWVAAFMAVLTVFAGLQVRKQVGAVQPPTDRQGRRVIGYQGVVDRIDLDAERDDDTMVFHVEPNATYKVEGVFDYDAQPEQQSGQHESRREGRHGMWAEPRGFLDPQHGV